MRKFLIVGLFCGAFLAVRFSGESPVADSGRGQGGVTVFGNGDVNGDGSLDLSDAIYLLSHLFQGGPAPELCPVVGPAEEIETAIFDADARWFNARERVRGAYEVMAAKYERAFGVPPPEPGF